jgi:3-deoxy-D-manno-octulosonic-acid transferase
VLFNFLFFFYALLYFPYLILTGRYYKGYGCRFGFFPQEMQGIFKSVPSSIWIHAVSVGEIMAIMPLISALRSRYPKETLVVTVTTKTGYELAQNKLSQLAIVIPSPLDFTWTVARFVHLIKPKIYVAAETEIWPNLFNYLSKRNVPIAIINGRISDRSLGRYLAIKGVLGGILQKVSLFGMQSGLDAERIKQMGAPEAKVVTTGNIKFDDVKAEEKPLGIVLPSDRLLWVAGSTHPGEEEIVLDVWKNHKSICGLMIAPRHIERTESILHLIQDKGFKAVRFSQLGQAPFENDTVVVVDTIGHLRSLYAHASFVFVGKSLCVGGGHNIIEPAMYAKPIVIGPLMENFRDITALFKAQEAILQVTDPLELEREVGRLVTQGGLREQLGQKALQVVKQNQGAIERTLGLLKGWL